MGQETSARDDDGDVGGGSVGGVLGAHVAELRRRLRHLDRSQ
jgi:hypothetical protein